MTTPRILVVEDERIIALHLRQQLIDLGYDVPQAVATGDEALRGIEAARPDLILMDINLKGRLDGIATAAAIPPDYHIPVIYLTAYSEDATVARAAATNPYGYLLKPFSERELHAMIQVSLARCRSERAAREAVEHRQQARKMDALSQLAGGLADEVNELLSMLYGQLETLATRAVGDPALAEPIQEAFGEAVETERLIQQLLDFSGRRKLVATTISVGDLVSSVVGELRHILGDAIELRIIVADDLWSVRIDAAQLARALASLATNAREAMQGGGTLTIEAQNVSLDQAGADAGSGQASRRYVLLSVADTGIGMADQVIERAFEPFFTARPDGGGIGLGLSLVFAFIRQSGGHISIDSKLRQGTTVRLWLPAPLYDFAEADRDPPTWADASGTRAVNRQLEVVDTETNAPLRRHDAGWPPYDAPARSTADSTSPILWSKAEDALYAAVQVGRGQRYRLVIEPLPRRDGWDWTVWRPGEAEESSRHGRASSVVGAMAAAEDAARHWEETEPPGG